MVGDGDPGPGERSEAAAGAGPVVTPPEHLPMDSDSVDSSDSEVRVFLDLAKSCVTS